MPISKLKKLSQIIKVNGGLKQSLYKLFIHDNLKDGKKIGEDQYGNRYFENNRYFRGANRWVEYNPDVFLDYDPTMMDPEWHGYMHHRTEYVPSEQPGRPPRYRWMLPVEENPSGTRLAYTPYSTTTPKIQHWIPPALGLQEKEKNLKTQDKFSMVARAQVVELYKKLLHLGKDYPQGLRFFRSKVKKAFLKNKGEKDPEKIKALIGHGNFVIKEIEALYMLRKYRTLKKRYSNGNQ